MSGNSPEGKPATHAPLEGKARTFGTIALSAAVFMNVLDSSIANVSIPTIAGDLGAVDGPMIPLSQSLMLASYPKEKASMALAFWSMTILVGPIAGPLLGGWISDNYSWSWIFYINVPIGLIAGWASWQVYKERDTAKFKLPIDQMGLTNFFRLVCGAFGTSITTTVWDNRASYHHSIITESVVPGEPAFDSISGVLGQLGLSQQHSAEIINGIIDQQAFTMSATDIFYISAWIFIGLTALIWFSKPITAYRKS